jgi:MFS family permease
MVRFTIIWMINSFALGVTLPVMNLMVLEQGASLASLALFMGLYSAIIVITEVPSGIFADRYGRKITFLIAKGCTVAGSLLLVSSASVGTLSAAVIFLGIARSFSSGSGEALTIDWYIEKHGINSLERITTRLSIWETIGLSMGSLSAGFVTIGFEQLGVPSSRYTGNFLFSILLQLIVIFCTVFWITEPQTQKSNTENQETSKNLLSIVRTNSSLTALLAVAFALGFLLSAVEKYWQPRLFAVTTSDETASILLGVIAFIGFAGALVGSLVSGKLLGRMNRWIPLLVILLRVLLAAALITLTFSTGPISFIIWYGGMYLILAMGSVAEQTLLNRIIPSEKRASLLSVSSFFLQIGGLVSSLCAAIWLYYHPQGINGLWIIASVVLILAIIPLIGVHRNRSFPFSR